MDTANCETGGKICPIAMLNYPEALAACCIPGECSAWRPDADAEAPADRPARGRCAVIHPEAPER